MLVIWYNIDFWLSYRRDHFVNVPSQWETTLQFNIISHWLSAFTKWSPVLSTHTSLPTIGAQHKLLLTLWGRKMHICISKHTIIVSDNVLSPGWCEAIIWTNAGILFISPLGTNFGEILMEIYKFSLKKMHLKMSSGKWWPFCLGLNVLRGNPCTIMLTTTQW